MTKPDKAEAERRLRKIARQLDVLGGLNLPIAVDMELAAMDYALKLALAAVKDLSVL